MALPPDPVQTHAGGPKGGKDARVRECDCVEPDCPYDHFVAPAAQIRVAALYVETDGVYFGLPDVDPWDEERDARLYTGPYPVVAHPPCQRWSLMGQCRGYRDGKDGGCFKAALFDVRAYGGVLEHPAHTLAWKSFDLPKPAREGWVKAMGDPGWSCEVDQRWYGHEANKPTWLYYVGHTPPPALRWGRAPKGEKTVGRSWGQGREHLRARTPIEFRDVLLDMARNATRLCVLACLDGHRFGAWASDEGAHCPDCGGTLRIEDDD